MVRFGDCFHASSVVATLLNEAFLLPPEGERNIEAERTVVKPAASPRKLRRNIREDIIFLFFFEERVLHCYTTEEFEQLFPNAVEHLTQYIVAVWSILSNGLDAYAELNEFVMELLEIAGAILACCLILTVLFKWLEYMLFPQKRKMEQLIDDLKQIAIFYRSN